MKVKAQGNYTLKIAVATLGILTIPLILTLVGSGVDGEGWHWTLSDFIVMGVLIFCTGLLLKYVTTKAHSKKQRLILAAAVVLVFLLAWIQLAVGIIDMPLAGS
jgi:Kef-type K+ transport system membrane component KefB